MSDTEERIVDDLRVVIDRTLCVGFGQCMDESSEAFRLNDDDVAEFAAPERVGRDELIAACKACPVEALRICDASGNQIVP